ncbi:MAG: hypothetical protein ACLFUG_11425 [Nitriliruptoraceae bacterium]
MSTVFQTGRDLSLEIDNSSYDAQASSVVLARTLNRERYEVLDGPVYKTTTVEGTLSVTMYSDWGEDGSLCEALETAAANEPDTSLPFTFTHGGVEFSGSVFPTFPDAGGEAPDVTQVTVELTLDASVDVTPGPAT